MVRGAAFGLQGAGDDRSDRRAIAAQRDTSVLETWWGGGDWKKLSQMKSVHRAMLFCERLKNEFGYKSVLSWPIFKSHEGTRVMYYMIHATDHPIAPNLMHRAYRNAVSEKEPPEQFVLELKQWESGQRDQGS